MTLISSVPIIYVSMLDSKVWKLIIEVNENLQLSPKFGQLNLVQYFVVYKPK